MPHSVSLRPATPADHAFLFQVYSASREEELAVVPWSAEEKMAFLRMQFDAQDRAYRNNYPQAAFHVIEIECCAIGRLYVERTPAEIHLIDIALIPSHRGHGIGTTLIREIVAEAARTNRPIRLYVEHFNPARRLYQRLGFAEVEEHGPYWRLAWPPAPPHRHSTRIEGADLSAFIEHLANDATERERLGAIRDHAAFAAACIAAAAKLDMLVSASEVRALLKERHLFWLQRHIQ